MTAREAEAWEKVDKVRNSPSGEVPLQIPGTHRVSWKHFCIFQGASFQFCLWRCKLGGTPWRSTELKECEIDARQRRGGKKSCTFLSPCTLASESASWFVKVCCSPLYFPLEKETISIQLHLLGERNRKSWRFGGEFFCVVFFFSRTRQYKTHRRGRHYKAGSQLQ